MSNQSRERLQSRERVRRSAEARPSRKKIAEKEEDTQPRESRQIDDVDGEELGEYIKKMTGGGKAQMHMDHDKIRKKERHVYFFMRNTPKNRFSNVVLYNEGAVILEKRDKEEGSYIHATKIKSRYGQFVLAQAPMQSTLFDWFRMMWQCKVGVVVCLLPLDLEGDCAKYFEKKQGKKVKCKRFTTKTVAVREESPLTMYELRFKNSDTKGEDKERVVHVVQYPKWHITRMVDVRHLLQLVRAVWSLEQSLASVNEGRNVTTLVHGITGTRRTGAYVITSMLCKQIRDNSQVSLLPACLTIRRYRYGVMRNRLMFATVLDAVLHFAADLGQVNKDKDFGQAVKAVRQYAVEPPNADDEEEEE